MMLTVLLLSALTMTPGKLYWAYVPNPPLLYSSIWSRTEVLVTLKKTQLLGFPWSESKKYCKLVNYTAVGQGLPICLTRNSTNNGCLSVDPQTWKKNISECSANN